MGSCASKKKPKLQPSDLNRVETGIVVLDLKRMEAQRHIEIDFERLKKIASCQNKEIPQSAYATKI